MRECIISATPSMFHCVYGVFTEAILGLPNDKFGKEAMRVVIQDSIKLKRARINVIFSASILIDILILSYSCDTFS